MKKLFSLLVSLSFLGFSALALYAYYFIHTSPSKQVEASRFEVPAGAFYKTANSLEDRGLITNAQYFTWYATLRGDANSIQVGEYELSSDLSPKEILDILVSGKTIKYAVTIPEGYNIFEIADVVEKAGLATREQFLSYVRNEENASKTIGLKVPSFEGFLFPETYHFSKQDTVKTMVEAMYEQFQGAYEKVMAQENKLEMNKLRHITLASIIEKETGAPNERPIISSVFHNRLNKRMRLQSDPTILYGIMMEDDVWLKNIKKSHIKRKTEYNTYTISGLPPSPIASPGLESLKAALNPKQTDYLYFVSQNDGTHVFSKTYKEHLRAVKQYQLNSKAREGKSWRDLNKK